MTDKVGYRAHIEAGKGLTHVLTPDGGAVPIGTLMEALRLKAVVRTFMKDDDPTYVVKRMVPEADIPEGNMEAAATAVGPERAIDDYSVTWVVDMLRSAADGMPVNDLKNPALKTFALDYINLCERQKLGDFGHHPDMEQDWLIEVEVLDSEFLNLRMEFSNQTPSMQDLRGRIWKALHCKYSVKCGNLVRSSNPWPEATITKLERWQKYSGQLGERHVALTKLMHELGEMQFKTMQEDAEKLDAIVGNTQSILYSQRSLLTRVADRLRRIYEAA